MRRTLIALAGVALVVLACGGGGGSPSAVPGTGSPTATGTGAASGSPTATGTGAASGSPSATGTGAASGSPAGDGATVELANSELGEILVDGEERLTLYGFVPDQVAGGVPTCYEDCAANWPALEADDSFTVGEGLDETMFAVVERTDGTTQLAIGDYPLYFFANDTAPGEVNGQGLGENWFVVGADGELIE